MCQTTDPEYIGLATRLTTRIWARRSLNAVASTKRNETGMSPRVRMRWQFLRKNSSIRTELKDCESRHCRGHMECHRKPPDGGNEGGGGPGPSVPS